MLDLFISLMNIESIVIISVMLDILWLIFLMLAHGANILWAWVRWRPIPERNFVIEFIMTKIFGYRLRCYYDNRVYEYIHPRTDNGSNGDIAVFMPLVLLTFIPGIILLMYEFPISIFIIALFIILIFVIKFMYGLQRS